VSALTDKQQRLIAERGEYVNVGDFIAINPEKHTDPFWVAKVLKIRLWSMFFEWYGDNSDGPFFPFVDCQEGNQIIALKQSRFLKDIRILHWGFKIGW
jgi:hypothetical protein